MGLESESVEWSQRVLWRLYNLRYTYEMLLMPQSHHNPETRMGCSSGPTMSPGITRTALYEFCFIEFTFTGEELYGC